MDTSSIQPPLRVLHVVLDMDLGGLQRVVHLLLQKHDRKRFLPFLCALDRGGMFYDAGGDISVERWILGRRPGPFDRHVFLSLYKIIRDYRIDIIHSHNGCGLYAVLAGRLAGVKAIVHTDHGRLVPDRRNAILEDRYTSYLMDRFIGVSEELTRYLAVTVKVSQKKLLTIINGIDTAKFVPVSESQRKKLRERLGLDEQSKVLGTVCRLDPIKNLEFLIKRMAVLSEKNPRCKLVIVGDGPDRERLLGYIREYKISDRVVMTGRMENIEEILPAFDVYVCSSLSEGTSMTLLEAMACELPIVATAVGGNAKLVGFNNGVLFPLNDAEAFDRAILRLVGDESIRSSLGKASRIKVINEFGTIAPRGT